jgi:hypothetical protein
VSRWCSERRIAPGAFVPLDQLWTLARSWYANRLDYEWLPRTPAEMERVFAAAGLAGEFWRV